MLCFH